MGVSKMCSAINLSKQKSIQIPEPENWFSISGIGKLPIFFLFSYGGSFLLSIPIIGNLKQLKVTKLLIKYFGKY